MFGPNDLARIVLPSLAPLATQIPLKGFQDLGVGAFGHLTSARPGVSLPKNQNLTYIISHTDIYGCRSFFACCWRRDSIFVIVGGNPLCKSGVLPGREPCLSSFCPCPLSLSYLYLLLLQAGWKLGQLGGQILFLWENIGYYFHLIYSDSRLSLC